MPAPLKMPNWKQRCKGWRNRWKKHLKKAWKKHLRVAYKCKEAHLAVNRMILLTLTLHGQNQTHIKHWQVANKMNTIQKCPVCEGTCIVPGNFYTGSGYSANVT